VPRFAPSMHQAAQQCSSLGAAAWSSVVIGDDTKRSESFNKVELESQLRVAVEQEDYAVRPPSRLAAPLCTARGRVQCRACWRPAHACTVFLPRAGDSFVQPRLPRSPPWQRLPQTHLVARMLTPSRWSPRPADSRALRLARAVTGAKHVCPSSPIWKGTHMSRDRAGRAHKGLC